MTVYSFISGALRKFVPGYNAYKIKKLYSSHMPILIGLGRIMAPRRVLELGSGTISTPAFLDPVLFPSLECLDSVEDDPDWGETVSRHIGPHQKLRLHQVASVPEWAATADLSVYDLVFIDDSRTIELREQTIRHVLGRVSPETVVVIHDFEMPPYQDAVPAGFERIAFSSFHPMTGVVWRGARWTVAIKQLAERIDARKHMSPLRHSAWRRYLASGTGPAC